MKVLITGHLGFVGMATTLALVARGDTVVGYDIMAGCDIRDWDQLHSAIEGEKPDRILHLAAISRFADADADPKLAAEVNIAGTAHVVKEAEHHHTPLVYASTGSVYMPIDREPPITEDFPARGNSVYGCSKYIGELYVRDGQAPWIILRYAHLYGNEKRGHGLVGGFLDRIERGMAPVLYGGAQSNDFTYVDDVVTANLAALDATGDKWRQVYNIGTGEELSTADAAATVCEVFEYDGAMETVTARSVDASRFVYDVSKAERMLGFKAKFSFRTGLEAMRASR